jgi:hypothetical protein
MITGNEIYWITRLDYLQGFILAIAIIPIVLKIGVIIAEAMSYDTCYEKEEKAKKLLGLKASMKSIIKYSTISILFLLTCCLIPSTKEMCVIKIIPIVANQGDIKEIPTNLAELANEWMEELRPTKKEE